MTQPANLYESFPSPFTDGPAVDNQITNTAAQWGDSRNLLWCMLYACENISGGGGGGGPVTLASGAVAAGAYSLGSYVAGAFVDGSDVTIGTKSDPVGSFPLPSSISAMSVWKGTANITHDLNINLCQADLHLVGQTPGVLGNSNDPVALTNTGRYSFMGLWKKFLNDYATNLDNILPPGQATMSNSSPVVIASDQSTIPVQDTTAQTLLSQIVTNTVNINTAIANLAQGNNQKYYLNSNGTFSVKGSNGNLCFVNVNTAGAGSSLTLQDAFGNFAVIDTSTKGPQTWNCDFTGFLIVIQTGATPADLTIIFN